MTVAELIEELKKMPQHHVVNCGRHEPITGVKQGWTNDAKTGPVVVVCFDYDGPTNDW